MNLDILRKFADYYQSNGIPTCIYQDALWVNYRRMVIPVGPSEIDYSLSPENATTILSRFPEALLLRTQTGCSPKTPPRQWYSVVCRNFNDISVLPAKSRSEIKRGLGNCSVEKVSAEFIADRGFDVFASAHEGYLKAGKLKTTKEGFAAYIRKMTRFSDIIHCWGVMNSGKLIGYAINHVYGNREVNYSGLKFHPDYLKLYPSYALFYTMNKYYLQENGVRCVNDGFRNLLHTTEIQDFLIRKFGFEKAYSELTVVYKPWFSNCMAIARPFKKTLAAISPKMSALLMLDSIANCKTLTKS